MFFYRKEMMGLLLSNRKALSEKALGKKIFSTVQHFLSTGWKRNQVFKCSSSFSGFLIKLLKGLCDKHLLSPTIRGYNLNPQLYSGAGGFVCANYTCGTSVHGFAHKKPSATQLTVLYTYITEISMLLLWCDSYWRTKFNKADSTTQRGRKCNSDGFM